MRQCVFVITGRNQLCASTPAQLMAPTTQLTRKLRPSTSSLRTGRRVTPFRTIKRRTLRAVQAGCCAAMTRHCSPRPAMARMATTSTPLSRCGPRKRARAQTRRSRSRSKRSSSRVEAIVRPTKPTCHPGRSLRHCRDFTARDAAVSSPRTGS